MRRVGWLQARFEIWDIRNRGAAVDVSKSIFHYLRIVLMYVHPYLGPYPTTVFYGRDRRGSQTPRQLYL